MANFSYIVAVSATAPSLMNDAFPIRINKYLALKKHATRRGADQLISSGCVYINGAPAKLGDIVEATDSVEVRKKSREYRYFAFNKPRGVMTNLPQLGEQSIANLIPEKGVFPIGRLDKDSWGLIIVTDDGRITDPLLNPKSGHEKEYEVHTSDSLPANFKRKMERGVQIGGYITKPCTVHILGERKFSIIISEGKKHQIRRMCGAFGVSATSLRRTRIINVKLGALKPGSYRAIDEHELKTLLSELGI